MSDSASPTTLRARWQQARAKAWVRWTMDLSVFAAIFLAIMAYQTRHLVGGGELAPHFELRTLDGELVRSSDLAGKPSILYFWAPWCGVCKIQSPTLSSFHKSYGDEVNVYAVVVDYGSVDELKAYVARENIDYPVLLGTRELAAHYRVNSFPTLYFLDKDSQVRRTVIGYTTGLGLRARLLL
ncbi:MAG: TlpA family protein disulfide reductase [Bradymonadaceae bacterium]|nr:TlpA family protein disulfide reductase [Lujinxingiaceae bacterium]